MKLENLSIRARVAYAAKSLEVLLLNLSGKCQMDTDWKFLLDEIWSYTEINPGDWHYPMAELTPSSIEEDIDFLSKGFDFLSEAQHDEMLKIYKKTDNDIKKVIELIFEIGTLDLYSSITNKSPKTLSMLQEVIIILGSNKLSPPNLEIFKRFTIDKGDGWGEVFLKEDLFI